MYAMMGKGHLIHIILHTGKYGEERESKITLHSMHHIDQCTALSKMA